MWTMTFRVFIINADLCFDRSVAQPRAALTGASNGPNVAGTLVGCSGMILIQASPCSY
jgi:hypothetical protein